VLLKTSAKKCPCFLCLLLIEWVKMREKRLRSLDPEAEKGKKR
jgi:hypothetical protein